MSTGLEITLAGTIILAAVIQIIILVVLYRALTRFSATAERLTNTLEPQLRDAAASMGQIRSMVDSWNPNVQATLASIRATTETLGDLAQREGRELARVVEQTTAVARRQVEETDRALDQTRHRVEEVLQGFDQHVLEPVRLLLAVAAGFRRGVERFTRSKPDQEVS